MPEPTRPYGGRTCLEWTDPARDEPFTPDPADRRELIVWVWYPTASQPAGRGPFAVGDVRSGSIKRVATAVGEGVLAIHLVREALAELAVAKQSSP